MQCHSNDVTLFAKQVQYEKSTHRLGGNFERATASCAPCHTHQGFLERMATGADLLGRRTSWIRRPSTAGPATRSIRRSRVPTMPSR